jgi:hypothetical protein
VASGRAMDDIAAGEGPEILHHGKEIARIRKAE